MRIHVDSDLSTTLVKQSVMNHLGYRTDSTDYDKVTKGVLHENKKAFICDCVFHTIFLYESKKLK
jgi:hypothetical protein